MSIRFCCRRRQEKKEREGKERKGKGREGTQSHKTLYFGYLWGGHPRPIPIKFGMRVAPRNVINVSNFCEGFRSTGGQSPRFPIDFAGHRYNSASAACDLPWVDTQQFFVKMVNCEV